MTGGTTIAVTSRSRRGGSRLGTVQKIGGDSALECESPGRLSAIDHLLGIVITAAREFGARGVGIEIDPVLVREARENARKAGVADKVEIRQGNMFEVDTSPATVVALYLLEHLNLRLRPKLLREHRPSARVVSHVFGIRRRWRPVIRSTCG